MRYAIADPPYLGRSRYYGSDSAIPAGNVPADQHADAERWDDPATHRDLLAQLRDEYDGWAVALASDVPSVALYARHAPQDARFLIWCKPDAAPSGSRITASTEHVLAYIPRGRRQRTDSALTHRSYLICAYQQSGQASVRRRFVGTKPPQWTRYVLDVLGFDPDQDELDDLFPGSGSVERVSRQDTLL